MSQAHWRTCWPLGFMSRHTTRAGGRRTCTLCAANVHIQPACTRTQLIATSLMTEQEGRYLWCLAKLHSSNMKWRYFSHSLDNYDLWKVNRECIYFPPFFFFFFFTSLEPPRPCIQWQPEPWPWMLLQCDTCKKYPCLYSHNCPCKCQYLTFTRWHTVNILHFTVYIMPDIRYVHSLNWGH